MNVFFTLICIIIMVVGKARRDGYAMEARDNARKRGDDTYFDGKYYREIKTNRKCRIDHGGNKNRILDFHDWTIIRDLNKEKYLQINDILKQKKSPGRIIRGIVNPGKITETEYDVYVEENTTRPFVLMRWYDKDFNEHYRLFYFYDDIVWFWDGQPQNIDPNGFRDITKEEYDKYCEVIGYRVASSYYPSIATSETAKKRIGTKIDYIDKGVIQ